MGKFELGHHFDTIKMKMFAEFPGFNNLPVATATFSMKRIRVRLNSGNHRSA